MTQDGFFAYVDRLFQRRRDGIEGVLDDLIARNVQKLDLRYPGGVYSDAANIARKDQQP